MVLGIKKYNPGFLSDAEIVASFCVREAEFSSLLESLRASDGNSNMHSLVIGPRAAGRLTFCCGWQRRYAATPPCRSSTQSYLPRRATRSRPLGSSGSSAWIVWLNRPRSASAPI